MKALVYSAPEKFEIKEIPTPEVKPHQVLIRVKACGLCGTDIHIHRGQFLSKFPLTPGHEFAGEIAEVGNEVTEFRPGDRVTADNTVTCGHCYYCRRNEPLFCENFYSLGCNGPGGFAEYVVVNHDKIFHLPDHLSYEEAIFTEPTSCVVHGMDILDLQPGADVLQFGAGMTGLILVQMLKHCGAANLVVAGRVESKLKLAEEFGATHVIKIDRSNPSTHTRKIKELFPKGFDVVIDATGAASVVERLFEFAKFGGKVVFYGVCDEDKRISVSPYEVFRKQLTIMGSFAQIYCFDRALEYIANGIVKVKKIVTHIFPLQDYAKALSTKITDPESLKIVIMP